MIRAVILEFMYMHGPGVAWRTPLSLKSASVYGIFSQVSWDMGKQSKISTPTKKVPARRSMEMSSLVFAMTSRIVAVLIGRYAQNLFDEKSTDENAGPGPVYKIKHYSARHMCVCMCVTPQILLG